MRSAVKIVHRARGAVVKRRLWLESRRGGTAEDGASALALFPAVARLRIVCNGPRRIRLAQQEISETYDTLRDACGTNERDIRQLMREKRDERRAKRRSARSSRGQPDLDGARTVSNADPYETN